MQNFAQSAGYQYSAQGDVLTIGGKILCPDDPNAIVMERKMYNVLTGSMGNIPCRVFNYQSTQTQKTRSRNETGQTAVDTYTVFEATLPNRLPDILVTPHIPGLDWLVGKLSASVGVGEQVRLEGDFYKHLTVYVPRTFEVDAYQMFTPDVMMKLEEMLQNKGVIKAFTFELIDNKLYLHIPTIITDNKEMTELLALTKSLFDTFSRNIKHM